MSLHKKTSHFFLIYFLHSTLPVCKIATFVVYLKSKLPYTFAYNEHLSSFETVASYEDSSSGSTPFHVINISVLARKVPNKFEADDIYNFAAFSKFTNKERYFMRIVCWQTILMKYYSLFCRKLRKISQKLSSAAVVTGALRVSNDIAPLDWISFFKKKVKIV